jgi:tetratricopeptide (TPR) repeat protein
VTALLFFVLLQTAQLAAQGGGFERLSQEAATARGSNQNDKALLLYRKALQLKPSWADGWWNIGSIYYEKEQYQEARDSFRKLIEIDNKAVAGYALLGICEYKTKDYDTAMRHLDAARLLGLPNGHPVAAAARYYLAVLLNQAGLHDAAADLLLGLSQSAAASAAVSEALGLAGLRITKLPEEITPEEREIAARTGEALAAASQRRGQESLPLMEALLKRYPTQPNLHYLYGIMLLQADGSQALDEFQKELQLQPSAIHVLLAIARELERTRRLEEARTYAEKAVRAGPSSFDTHALLGRILVAQGHVQEGAAELEKARDIDSGSPQVYFALASAYAKLGRNEDAEKARAEFLRLKEIADKQQ